MTIDEYHKFLQKQNRGKSAASEHDLQVQCVRWFRLTYPNALIYAIPNGGYRAATTARIMKSEGQQAGIPDLHIPIARGDYHSLYIEMKNGKAGKVSEHQDDMIKKLRLFGHKVAVCRSFDEFEQVVNDYLSL